MRFFIACFLLVMIGGCVQTTHMRSPYSPLLGAEVLSVTPLTMDTPLYPMQAGLPVTSNRETGYSPQFRADMPSAAPLPIYPPSYYGNSVAKTGIKTQSGSKRYFCGQNKQCSNIKTCDEARYLLKHCGLRRLDRDGDGVPCESLCSGGQ